MMTLVGIIIGILIVFILILITRIYTTVYYTHRGEKNLLKIELRMWKIKILSKEISIKDFEMDNLTTQSNKLTKMIKKDEKEKKHNNAKKLVDNIKKAHVIVNKLIQSKTYIQSYLSKINIHKFYWNTGIGTGEASSTAVLYGGIWTVKGCIFGSLSNNMNVIAKPNINVKPHFNQKLAFTEIECIFSVRIGQTIYAFIQLYKRFNGNFSNGRVKRFKLRGGHSNG